MKQQELSTRLSTRAVLVLLTLALLSPFALIAQDPADGWEEVAEGLYLKEAGGVAEYLAQGVEGNANLLPIIQTDRIYAEKSVAADPSESNLALLDGLTTIEEQVSQMGSKGAAAVNATCTDFGGYATTQPLACGNEADSLAWASTSGNCTGPFTLFALAQVTRDCGNSSQFDNDSDALTVPTASFGLASATATLVGAFSSCSGMAISYAGSGADGISNYLTNPGGSVSCSSNQFICAHCIRGDIDDPF